MYFKSHSNFSDIQENFEFFDTKKPLNWILLVLLIVALIVLGYLLYNKFFMKKEKFGYKFY
jgi:hypothetical protein